MAKTFIQGNVKIGGIYECNFGLFKNISGGVTKDRDLADESDMNHKIPNELIKKRPVVVVGKHRGLCLVAPISTKKETHKKPSKIPEVQGIHVKLTENDFPTNSVKYSNTQDMWVKCNLVTHVDAGRLRDLKSNVDNSYLPVFVLENEVLRKIREGIILSIGMAELLEEKC